MSRSSRHGVLGVLGAALLCLLTQAAPALARPHGFHYDVPVQATSPWPEMRRDSRNSGRSPIRARYDGGRALALPHRPRHLLDPGDRRRRQRLRRLGRPRLLRAAPRRAAALEAPHRRHHRRRRGDRRLRPAAAHPADHDRLRRRAPLPPARRRPPPLPRAAGDLALPRHPSPGDRPAGQLVGGQRRHRPRRDPLRRQHRRRRLRDPPQRPAALGLPGRQLGLDDAGLRPRRDHLLGLGRPARLRPRRPPVSRSGAAPSPATSPPRRRSAATAPSTSAPSTASCTRSTPTPASTAGASPAPITSTARRRWPRMPRGTPGRSTSAPPTARSTRFGPTAA